jgi:hypothetical protein
MTEEPGKLIKKALVTAKHIARGIGYAKGGKAKKKKAVKPKKGDNPALAKALALTRGK